MNPEQVDLFGIHHRYGCRARVTSRPASIAGRILHRCLPTNARGPLSQDRPADMSGPFHAVVGGWYQ